MEVTCNLFSLYCMETLCGKPPGTGHDAMKPEAVDKRLRGYLGMSDKFERWKKDPFLALTMYNQLRAGFGWPTYQKVFAEYRDLPKAAQPKSDDENGDRREAEVICTKPFGLSPPKLTLQKPHRDERVNVDECQAPILRDKPREAGDGEYDRKGP